MQAPSAVVSQFLGTCLFGLTSIVSLSSNPHFSGGAFAGRFRGSNYVFPGGLTTILTYFADDPGSPRQMMSKGCLITSKTQSIFRFHYHSQKAFLSNLIHKKHDEVFLDAMPLCTGAGWKVAPGERQGISPCNFLFSLMCAVVSTFVVYIFCKEHTRYIDVFMEINQG